MVEIASSPWLEIGVGEQIEDLVRAGAADDAVGIEPEGAADRLAQHARGAFRIVLEMVDRVLVGLLRLGRGPERRLVGRELEHLAARLRHRALAGRVGRNVEDAGIRHGAVHLELRIFGHGLTIWPPRSGGPYSALHGCRRGPSSARRPLPGAGPA